jgi:hypothetical protein
LQLTAILRNRRATPALAVIVLVVVALVGGRKGVAVLMAFALVTNAVAVFV